MQSRLPGRSEAEGCKGSYPSGTVGTLRVLVVQWEPLEGAREGREEVGTGVWCQT